jgi:hypothetical protein
VSGSDGVLMGRAELERAFAHLGETGLSAAESSLTSSLWVVPRWRSTTT